MRKLAGWKGAEVVEHSVRARIEAVRRAALHLHKVLIEALRLDHEREFGRLESPAELLRLLAYDARFAWLRALSQQLVAIDDQLAAEAAEPAAVRGEVERTLLEPSFQQPYLNHLQRAPDVVLAHAALQRELAGLPLPASLSAPR
jgi:hypothetical protein